jgi:hypothetical protein
MSEVVMRNVFALVFCAVILGCGGSSPSGNNGGGGSGGSSGDGGGAIGSGPKGATCTTACDCMPGLGCSNGSCGGGTASAYYCCDQTGECPTASVCEFSNGQIGTCGSDGGAGSSGGSGGTGGGAGGGGGGGGFPGLPDGGFHLPDGGISQLCGVIPCSSDTICKAAQCGTCDLTTKKCK